jgi:serine protease
MELLEFEGERRGAHIEPAWDVTTGSNDVVVAVLDSGVRPGHFDLAGRLLPGYDFVGDPRRANDGDGRDADSSDPWDRVTQEDIDSGGIFQNCKEAGSLWHGTTVAGIIGATTNNALGTAGIDWRARVLPVRVAGKCGGVVADLIAAIRWSAGIGAPTNPTPARIVNLSLGSQGVKAACPGELQSAINDVSNRGVIVVVGAGNDNRPAADTWPANCEGVIAVGATRRTGARDPDSNYGSTLALSAPGGAQSDVAADVIRGLGNAGTTTPGADAIVSVQGTSFAAPHVSGVVALMLAMRPDLKPHQVREILVKSARPFVRGTNLDCTVALCGGGMLDGEAAFRATRAAASEATTRESTVATVM